MSRPVRITLAGGVRVLHAAGSTGYDDVTEVVILTVDDTERDFATRAFGVPAFTAATSTVNGTHVVVIDGRIAFMEPRATTKNGNAVSNVYLARLPLEDDAEAPDRRDAA